MGQTGNKYQDDILKPKRINNHTKYKWYKHSQSKGRNSKNGYKSKNQLYVSYKNPKDINKLKIKVERRHKR